MRFYPALFTLAIAACLSIHLPAATLSHGPMLGGVTDTYAGIWLRTDAPATVEVQMREGDKSLSEKGATTADGGLSFIANFNALQPGTRYTYRVAVDGQSSFETNFTTLGAHLASKPVRIVYASCYAPKYAIKEGTNEFMKMNERNADAVIFLGDFPYTAKGELEELRTQHAWIRKMPGFRDLTASRPVYAIWDDHDFGPNDADGKHPKARQAFRGFKEHWPSPALGLPDVPGIFSNFRFGDIEIFRLDCRTHSLRTPENSTMLGEKQTEWLHQQLKQSTARYKLICSGPQLWRNKGDSWGGEPHREERDRLLEFIRKENLTGVVFISGDVHRSNIHRKRFDDGRYIYDFTSSGLAQKTRVSPKDEDWVPEMIFSHPENNQFCELDFHPAGDKNAAITYRVFSVTNGLVQKFTVPPAELGLK